MKTSRVISLVLVALVAATTLLPAQEVHPVDAGVVLDTPGGMENVLGATRARLMDMINEVNSTKITTPQDGVLLELNASLNATYVPYGEHGAAGLGNRLEPGSHAPPPGGQGCGAHSNASWDLVDKSREDGFDWGTLSLSDLPEALRDMSNEGRNEFIEDKRAERERLQQAIQQVTEAREPFVQRALAERFSEAGLREAMRQAMREQYGADPDNKLALALRLVARSKGNGWATVQITDEPDTPIGSDSPTAWTSKTTNMGEVWIELDYDTAVTPEQVRIHETFNPGAVKAVLAKDRGDWTTLWSGTAPAAEAPHWFEPPLESVSVRTRTIRIVLDTDRQDGWNEIDAVELIGDGSRQWAHDARASSAYGD